jgi:hypothetical protein
MAKARAKARSKKSAAAKKCKLTTKVFKKTYKLKACAKTVTAAKAKARKLRKAGMTAVVRGRGVYSGGKRKVSK